MITTARAGSSSCGRVPVTWLDRPDSDLAAALGLPEEAVRPWFRFALPAPEAGRGLRVTLDADVLFDFDRAELRPEAGPRFQRLMQEVSARIPRPAASRTMSS